MRTVNMGFRRKTYAILQPDDGSSILSRIFDWLITSFILLSIITVFLATFDLPLGVLRVLTVIENVVSIVFTIEYILRIATADFLYPQSGAVASRLKYVISPMAIIDLAAILPFWLPMFIPGTMLGLRAFRLFRLLRIFKLNRYFDAMKTLGAVIASKKRELLGSVFVVFIIMLISSLLMYSAEHDTQPDVFRNAFSGLWWAVATLTTVGYGDIYPVTALGRIIGAVIAFSGIAAVAIPTGIISSGLMEGFSHGKVTDVPKKEKLCEQERDRIVREQIELLKSISERLARLEARTTTR